MMGYINGFVASIFHDGVPIRESNVDNVRTIRLPFNSEYQILLKNTGTRRAKAQIIIDGVDISSLGKFVLPPGSSTTIERFVDSFSEGKKFKFISKEEGIATGALQDPTSPQLGIIEVRFWSEIVRLVGHWPSSGILRSTQKNVPPTVTYSSATIHNTTGAVTNGSEHSTWQNGEMAFASAIGGTAEGSASLQKFHTAEDFETEWNPTTIKLRILAPELAKFIIQNGWVVKQPENIRITDTWRVEKGEIWAKLG